MPVNNLEHRRNRRNVDDRERTADQFAVGIPATCYDHESEDH